MHSVKLCNQYLSFLNNGDVAGVVSLFKPSAVVVDPLAGTLGVAQFHEYFFTNVKQSKVRIENIFATVNDVSAVALHYSYDWLLANGNLFTFDGINIFEMTEDGRRFSRLTFLYDSEPLRRLLGQDERMPHFF